MSAIPTDFTSTPRPVRASWPGVGVVGVVSATFALGFTEGCLEIERRPIPLRFALRFAVANVLPSAVWSSVPAHHVAAASGVPLSALISDVEIAGSRSVSVGKRLVLVKSVRALRLAVGSYGLAWGLWCWHEAGSADSNNNTDEGVMYGESVVRFAPVNSPLSRASRRKHGEHIVTVPVASESWKRQSVNRAVDAVDWEKVGVQAQVESGEPQQVERVKVLEVELSDSQATSAYAAKLKANAVSGGSTSLCSVAVLPPFGLPLPKSIVEVFDVCFNPMSAVLTFVASVCHDRGVAHVFLVADGEDESTRVDNDAEVRAANNSSRLHLSMSQLAAGLLYRHGITTTVLKTPQRDGQANGASVDDRTSSDPGIVFFISEGLIAGRAAAADMVEQGLVTEENVCFIVEGSFVGQGIPSEQLQAQSALLEISAATEFEARDAIDKQEENGEGVKEAPGATCLSIADVSDQTLQGIRKLVRQGKKPDAIQAAVYQAYGSQRVVAPARPDQFSDMHV